MLDLGLLLAGHGGPDGTVAPGAPVDDLLAAPDTPRDLKRRLELGMRVRDFASRELALPDNQSYRRYAALDRPYVVWNVFAAPNCRCACARSAFPVAGLRGVPRLFRREARNAGPTSCGAKLDVHVGGVPAYSTLGWFADPLVSTFIRYPDRNLRAWCSTNWPTGAAYATDDSSSTNPSPSPSRKGVEALDGAPRRMRRRRRRLRGVRRAGAR